MDFFQCQFFLAGRTRQWYKHLMWHRLRYKLLQLWGKPLTLIFGCFSISSTIMPDLQKVWLMWQGIWIYQETTRSRNFCYPLNAATQRGASPNSFKWFGSSPRVASSFTMSVYLWVSCKNSIKSVCSHAPFAAMKQTRKNVLTIYCHPSPSE